MAHFERREFLSPGALGEAMGLLSGGQSDLPAHSLGQPPLAIPCSPHHLPIKDCPFLNESATLQSISPSLSLIQGLQILPQSIQLRNSLCR